VGKSTFFNKLAGRRISIVQNIPGVTRDRIIAESEWCGKVFTIVDTGGIEFGSPDKIQAQILKQANFAVEAADVIVFLADFKSGITPGDYAFADYLRKSRKPVVLAVNKVDNYAPDILYGYYELGLGEPFGISAEGSTGLGDLLDEVVKNFSHAEPEPDTDAVKIAVVGRPNTGKSSLVNKILNEERMIVSDIAGTTRDSIDTPITLNGQKYIIIDTAGIRRKRGVESGSVEAISALMAMKSIDRADAVVVLLDATEPISEQDVRIAGYVDESGKPSVIAVNKWDAVEKDTYTSDGYVKVLKEELKFMDYHLPVFISAKSGMRIGKAFELARLAYDNSNRRISTGVLNEIITEAVSRVEPPTSAGRRLKIFYVTQASTAPPTFILFVNDEKLLHFSYKRYLENALRAAADFSGTPIRLIVREKE